MQQRSPSTSPLAKTPQQGAPAAPSAPVPLPLGADLLRHVSGGAFVSTPRRGW